MLRKSVTIRNRLRGLQSTLFLAVSIAVSGAVSGCATLERLPAVTYAQAKQTDIFDIPDARFYVSERKQIDDLAIKAAGRLIHSRGASTNRNFLAISGGGDDGAFGAGVLVGWSERGDRPVFDIVTGVSTGSLSAPFVFLGQKYDAQLKEIYTQTTASDIFVRRPTLLAAVASDAVSDSAPLRRMASLRRPNRRAMLRPTYNQATNVAPITAAIERTIKMSCPERIWPLA